MNAAKLRPPLFQGRCFMQNLHLIQLQWQCRRIGNVTVDLDVRAMLLGAATTHPDATALPPFSSGDASGSYVAAGKAGGTPTSDGALHPDVRCDGRSKARISSVRNIMSPVEILELLVRDQHAKRSRDE
ncbi:hypothetical protein ACFRDV_40060 [Streptomyces fagopyri]|uniref:hypothetical protein n=1 Tax=Streptomyces fagopyri TaxID=2662397 RepID=UPI00368C62E6